MSLTYTTSTMQLPSCLLRFFSAFLATTTLVAPVLSLVVVARPQTVEAAVNCNVITQANKVQCDKLAQQKREEAAAAAAEAARKKTISDKAAAAVKSLNSQISETQDLLENTQLQIDETRAEIGKQNQSIAELESSLSRLQSQQDALVRYMYVVRQASSGDLDILANEGVSSAARNKAQFTALVKSVAAIYAQTTQAKMAVQASKDQSERKNAELSLLQSQQQDQQRSLSSAKYSQQLLQRNAEAAVKDLEAQAAAAKAQAALIAERINRLVSITNWGSQIVSSNDSSWYYTQTGNQTRLGNSWETVNNSGCLITSIAMVSTYYGTAISPTWMATRASFTYQGYYYWGTPSNLGVSLRPYGGTGINWGVVQGELDAGRPVIVSIYLPSVGAVNSDGSSHYIVIRGRSGDKYLMHDPIGDGRGYNMNQVRSMILTSPR